MEALAAGFGNLEKQIENVQKFGVPAVVAINAFPTDTEKELTFVEDRCREMGADAVLSEVWAKGGEGGVKLAEKVIEFSSKALKDIKKFEEDGLGDLPICMAKTQYSLSDDPTLLGRPSGFTVSISEVKVSAGAGFLVAMTGDIMRMPGLPKVPAANKIDILENGEIV
ncbi:Formate-tetrahydrofolate ligase, FTHFS like protein, partial [Aduncisulcus paluster]